ncbi:MAG TPA: putative baseplate assembly protein [Pyrinomonadaceae bacterium]|nr:putative baseplate assembly protein [Pyrinomonadaceae bacterium]
MPLQLPTLDDRNYEQLLQEAKSRIPVHTPEWTNFNVESDPGITIVELFAFLTESLLYRVDRYPESNRLKFLQLLGIPLQPAAPAQGLIVIRNERGPVEPLLLRQGVIVAAGNVQFLTLDALNVLPVEALAYYKRRISKDDPRYAEFSTKYQAIKEAAQAALESAGQGAANANTADATKTAPGMGEAGAGAEQPPVAVELDFYETTQMLLPTASAPNTFVNLANDETTDHTIYLALLAPKNVDKEAVREALANQTISIGVVPALTENVPPLLPRRLVSQRQAIPALVYEIPDVSSAATVRYERLRVVQQPDVLNEVGIVQLALPGKDKLQTWSFTEPLQEGTGQFPPRIEDNDIRERLLTWICVRLPRAQSSKTTTGGSAVAASGSFSSNAPVVATASSQPGALNARLNWIGINSARVRQAIPVFNELLGTANGEPDQAVMLANTPVIEDSVFLEVEDITRNWQLWQKTDDLLAADEDDEVFVVDPESGQVRFGDGLRGARPPAGSRIRASYLYSGGTQGNVAIGAIKSSPDVRLQGGFKVENPIATWGGDLGETVEEGERNIPRQLRHRDRAVTVQDFKDITRRTPGVDIGRVEVLPLFHPDKLLDNVAGVVTLMVVPSFDTLRPRTPTPNRLFLRTVCDYLDERRLVTNEIYVRGPVYRSVSLSVGIEIRAGYFRDQVIQDVRVRLEEYLSALPPGGSEEEGWELNKRLLKKDLEAMVTRVAGVEFVNSMELGVEKELNIEGKQFTGLQLPRLDLVSVREGEAEALADLLVTATPQAAEPTTVPVPVRKSKC